MILSRMKRELSGLLFRVMVLGLIVGAGWLLLQFYSREEISAVALEFWQWWSMLLPGELGRYWNPAGAGITLAVVLWLLLNPILRLIGGKHSLGNGQHDGYTDYGDDLGDESD